MKNPIPLGQDREELRRQEDALWKSYAIDHSPETRKALAEFHWPLCYSVSLKFINKSPYGKHYKKREEEIVSEASVILLRCIDGFNSSLGFRFSTYFCNSFFRTILPELARRNERERDLQLKMASAEEVECHTRSTETFEEETGFTIDEALSCLPDRDREIVEIRFISGMTFEAIAELYGVTKERVRQIIENSLRKIRVKIGAHLDGSLP